MITNWVYLGYFRSYFLLLTVVVLMSNFKNKNSLRTIEAEISSRVKNNEARPKFTGSYKKSVYTGSHRQSSMKSSKTILWLKTHKF